MPVVITLLTCSSYENIHPVILRFAPQKHISNYHFVMLNEVKHLAQKRREILRYAQNDRIDVFFRKQPLGAFTVQHDRRFGVYTVFQIHRFFLHSIRSISRWHLLFFGCNSMLTVECKSVLVVSKMPLKKV